MKPNDHFLGACISYSKTIDDFRKALVSLLTPSVEDKYGTTLGSFLCGPFKCYGSIIYQLSV